jgi:DNA-binding NarL/FixJ family response regulator
MSSIRVSIFSDDPFVREGLRQLIAAAPACSVVSGDHALRDGTVPGAEVLLIDSRSEGVFEFCSKLDAERPRLIFLSVPNDAFAIEALAAGARGIVRRDGRITDVIRAILAVNDGEIWAPRHVIVDAWLRHRRAAAPESHGAGVERQLSGREFQVVKYVASGMGNIEIADRLAIRPATVKAHLTNVYQKLGVQGRGELSATYHGSLRTGARAKPAPALRRLA